MARVLLLMGTQTYKAESFLAAARRLQVDVVVGTHRTQALSHLNPDGNLTLSFGDLERSARTVRAFAARLPLDAVVATDDDGAPLAAVLGETLDVAHHPLEAVRKATDKLSTRRALAAAGLRTPRLWSAPRNEAASELAERVAYPCVLKPRHLSGSRGVMRADDPAGFERAHARLCAILEQAGRPAVAPREQPEHEILVEEFVPGREVALEGVLDAGRLRTLAIFDKPDLLDGPFFEETLYVTPSRHPRDVQRGLEATTESALGALGLRHGAVHAELRFNDDGIWLLEAAPRSIGGLCAQALRFGDGSVTLEQLLLLHALGRDTAHLEREAPASGVMMIPIPRPGILRAVAGVEQARAVPRIADVRITVAPGQPIAPPPEGARYLGFLFARADHPAEVEQALRASHAKLHIRIDTPAQAAPAATDAREKAR